MRQWEPSLASSDKNNATEGIGKIKDRRIVDEAPFNPITGIQFSPTRPLVFAASSMSGCVFLYDLVENENSPTAVLEVPPEMTDNGSEADSKIRPGTKKAKRTSALLSDLSFNRRQRGFVAAADLSGAVHIWRLGWGLTAATQSEAEKLEAMESLAAGRQ